MTAQDLAKIRKAVARARQEALTAVLLAQDVGAPKPVLRRLKASYDHLDVTFTRLGQVERV